MIDYIDATIVEAEDFLQSLDISSDKIIGESNTLDRLDELRSAYDTPMADEKNINHYITIQKV